MTIMGIISALVVGVVIGLFGRLVAPGGQNISLLVAVFGVHAGVSRVRRRSAAS
jgi:uncharacterized membrane protein YeaQ/YmgE (transglycosylase-associated protein family)